MPEEWLIDGYNLLHSLSPRGSKKHVSREKLFNVLSSFASIGRRKIWMVLDGIGNDDEFKSYETDFFHVFYSQGVSADTFIERRLFEKKGQMLHVVVTHDTVIRQMARGMGARVLSAMEFLDSLESLREEGQSKLLKERADSHGFNRPFDKKLKEPS